MNTPVSLSLARLLKDKKFDEPCSSFYKDSELREVPSSVTNKRLVTNSQFMTSRCFTAPTVADVIMWLYEKHNIWISVHEYQNVFSWGIQKFDLGSVDNFNSPKEAYQNAIEYVLTHLVTPNETYPQV